jgi:hypothetical protein
MDVPALLLTSSAIPFDSSVKLIDPSLRIKHTLESIEQWLKIAPEIQIVVCDGSNYDFTQIVRTRFPGARIECLYFNNDQTLVAHHGKGYGEGEIIKYAIHHSAVIQRSGYFAKCTGKLWVNSFWQCLEEWNGRFMCAAHFKDVFSLKKTRLAYIDTRFYLAEKDFYLKYFNDAHLGLGGPCGYSIEDSFRDIVLDKQLQGVLFKRTPEVDGVGGGSGTYIKNNTRRRLKSALRLRLVQANKVFSPLFASSRPFLRGGRMLALVVLVLLTVPLY